MSVGKTTSTCFLVILLLSASINKVPIEPLAKNGVDVTIRWTSYGILRVNANDWRSLGYRFPM